MNSQLARPAELSTRNPSNCTPTAGLMIIETRYCLLTPEYANIKSKTVFFQPISIEIGETQLAPKSLPGTGSWGTP
jgi:hypothetical protein